MSLDPWSYAEKANNESSHQTALFMWANMARMYGRTIANSNLAYSQAGWAKEMFDIHNDRKFGAVPIPELEWLHAIRNEEKSGSAIRGANSRAMGVKAGVPDIFLPVPIWQNVEMPYGKTLPILKHGLYIELKRPASKGKPKGAPSPAQLAWIDYLASAGYAVGVFYGWQAARDAILRYLGKGG